MLRRTPTRFESNCGAADDAPGLPYADDAWFGPAPTLALPWLAVPASDVAVFEATVLDGAPTGVRNSASSESMRYCGVCTEMP